METGKGATMSRKRTAHSMSSSSLRRRSEVALVTRLDKRLPRAFLVNLQEVLLGTKLALLFPAVPLAVAGKYSGFGQTWVFALSLLGLAPLAERVSFLTEQLASYTGPAVGGLLNATCGNATELIIAVWALMHGKLSVVKYSLLGSVLSNLLLVLGTSLFLGGIANRNSEQRFDRRQADVNTLMLLLALLCHTPPMIFLLSPSPTSGSGLVLSRASSVVMLVAYLAYLVFQIVTHGQLFDQPDEDANSDEEAVIGAWSALAWLAAMTAVIALLSEYVVGTIEEASSSWGVPVSFIGVILLPVVGNAAEHAGAIIFAFKNKLDISLGVALGSATQIAMFVVPLSVVIGWVMGIGMDLQFSVMQTACLALSVLLVAFTLQDGTSHYMKGFVLLLAYVVLSLCFLLLKTPSTNSQWEEKGVDL